MSADCQLVLRSALASLLLVTSITNDSNLYHYLTRLWLNILNRCWFSWKKCQQEKRMGMMWEQTKNTGSHRLSNSQSSAWCVPAFKVRTSVRVQYRNLALTVTCFVSDSNPSMTPCAAPPWPGWVAMGVAERMVESLPTTSPRPFRRCPAWATLPAWDWAPPACEHQHDCACGEGQAGRQAGRVGQKESTRLKSPQKTWLSGLSHLFSWLSANVSDHNMT